ncbi:GNAT family N-acetyltransferase [Streptomyces klenkii]|uniref:GNAT family N-acetyltransferase n=1 Tax=Streptomyces klenkii TaxID=1420899 RepID=UPI0036E04231
MTPYGPVSVQRLDGPAAAEAAEAFRLVYAEVFAGPPYFETEDGVAAMFRRFPVRTREPGFRGALARTGEGEPVGITYGYPLRTDPGVFKLMELAVRAPWRRRGVGRALHDAVVGGHAAGRMALVTLDVHRDNTAAQAAYRSWGYEKTGETRPWPGADPHDVLLLALPRA